MTQLTAPKAYTALADPSRFKLFSLILKHSAVFNPYENKPTAMNCASKLVQLTGLSQATVSHHLQILKQAQLVYTLRKGKFKFIFPKEETLTELGSFGDRLLQQYRSSKQNETLAIIDFGSGNAELFSKAMSFLAVHGFKKLGPTTFADNKKAIKYNLIRRGQREGLLEIVYVQNEGKIFISKPVKEYEWIKRHTAGIIKKLQQFIN